MDRKVRIIIGEGFEEGEALVIIDVMRRCGIECLSVGLDRKEVTGAHGIVLRCDTVLDESVKDADMIVLPGGYGGTEAMCASEELREVLKEMDADGKYVCAICAAPEVLYKAGLLKDRKYTAYPGTETKIADGIYVPELIVQDGNIITGKGPAVAYRFAYYLADQFGADTAAVKAKMLYDHTFDERKEA